MFPARYFGARYYPPRYFGKVGADAAIQAGYFGHRYFGPAYFGPRYFSPAATIVVTPTTRSNWDTSDPLFYDWWRKRADEARDKLEFVQAGLAEYQPDDPPLKLETIKAIERATSVAEIQSLDLLKYERDILRAAIAEYQAMIDQDEEEAEFLLLH